MSSAYVKSLYRGLPDEEGNAPLSQTSLRQRFIGWFDSVPEISRMRPYAMSELEQALNTQGRYLSPILLSLGWQRRRKWSTRGQYHRYWVPPGDLPYGSMPPPCCPMD